MIGKYKNLSNLIKFINTAIIFITRKYTNINII